MRAAQFAKELRVSPATLSKWISLYHTMSETERSTDLNDYLLEDFRAARELMRAGDVHTFRQALMALRGETATEVPRQSAALLFDRLGSIETTQLQMRQQLTELTQLVSRLIEVTRQDSSAQSRTGSAAGDKALTAEIAPVSGARSATMGEPQTTSG